MDFKQKIRILSHKWRAHENAILIGAQTLRDDNPKLTTRNWNGNNCTHVLPKIGAQEKIKI